MGLDIWHARLPSHLLTPSLTFSRLPSGRNVTPKNIRADCEASLRRLNTDHLDVYLLHWPARYSPQSNWGQSLEYKASIEQYSSGRTSIEQIAAAMGELVRVTAGARV